MKACAFAFAYYVFGRLGLLSSVHPHIATAIWPAAGIGLTTLLFLGMRAWPAVFVGALAIDIPILVHAGWQQGSWMPLVPALGMAAAATFHALLGTYLIRTWVPHGSPFTKTVDIFSFLVAEGISTALSASLGTVFLVIGGFERANSHIETWVTWWTGDLVGSVLVTPFVYLLFRPQEKLNWTLQKKLEGVFLLMVFFLCCGLVFGLPGATFPRFAHFFILTPFFLWAAYRFSGWGVLIASAVMTIFTVVSTQYPFLSPFSAYGPNWAVLFSQAAIAIHIVVGLLVAAEAYQRRKNEEELRISVAEHVSDIVANVDLRGRLIWANPAFDSITSFSRDAWVGRPVVRLVQREDLRMVVKKVRELVRGETGVVVAEFRIRSRDGSFLVMESTVKLTRSTAPGRKASLSIVSRDITRLKRARAQLEREVALRTSALYETEARLSAIFQQSPCGIAQVDLNGHFIFVTDRFCEIVGWPREELLRLRAHDLTHPEDLDLNVKEFEICVTQGTPYSIEKRYVRRDGQTVWVNNTVSALRDAAGSPTSVVAVCEDLTTIKRAQAEVAEREERFRTIADASPIMMCTCDEKGKVFFNKAWRDFSGITTAAETRDGWVAGIHPDDAGASQSVYRQALESRSPYQMEYRLQRYDGDYRWILECGTPRTLPDGTYLGLMGTALDITGRKLAEIERQRAIEALQNRTAELVRSNDELARFAYVASHDLKEPIRVISMQLQLLAKLHDGKLPPGSEQCIQFAVSSAKRMYDLIDDLLAFSRVGTSARAKRLRETNLNDVMAEVLANLKVAVLDSDAEITVENLPPALADRAEATLVFQNLISNAIKYRSAEKPRITVGSLKSSNGQICYFVRDNGIGIEPRHFEKIFVLFQRLHNTETYPGTGIGLAVCKKIIEQMGGKIWLESEPQHGSTFFFTFPSAGGGTVIPLRDADKLQSQRA